MTEARKERSTGNEFVLTGKEVRENMNLFDEFRRSVRTMTIEEAGQETRSIDKRKKLGGLLNWTGLTAEERREGQNRKEDWASCSPDSATFTTSNS